MATPSQRYADVFWPQGMVDAYGGSTTAEGQTAAQTGWFSDPTRAQAILDQVRSGSLSREQATPALDALIDPSRYAAWEGEATRAWDSAKKAGEWNYDSPLYGIGLIAGAGALGGAFGGLGGAMGGGGGAAQGAGATLADIAAANAPDAGLAMTTGQAASAGSPGYLAGLGGAAGGAAQGAGGAAVAGAAGGAAQGAAEAAGRAAPGLIGAIAANDQTQAIKDLARQQKTQYDEFKGYGAPYRQRLSDLYADPSAFLASKEVQTPVQQGSDIMARSLSMGGNPVGSGNALQQLQSYSADQLFGKLGQEKDRLGGFGGLSAYNQAAASGAGNQSLNLAGIQSGYNMWNALGSSANNIFNPPKTFAQQMAEWKSLGGW